MKIAIVILNWNAREYIGKCLRSLERFEAEKIVVDNGSTDDSAEYIAKQFPQFELIKAGVNLGYAGGNNVGLRAALSHGAEAIWIVNPDIMVKEKSLDFMMEVLKRRPDVGIVGSKVYFALGFEFHKEKYKKNEVGKVIWYAGGKIDWGNIQTIHLGMNEVDGGQYDAAGETEFVTGASMLLRGSMLVDVGLLDEKYFLYFEESDLCVRAKNKDWKLWYEPESVVWHANAQATGVGSPLVDYYTTRNRLLFGLRWAPLRSKIALIRESMRLLISGRKWQKQGVVDFYLNHFGIGSYVK